MDLLQVAERALFLWNNDHIVSLVAQNRHVVLPLVYPALARNETSHWNQAVHSLTMNVRKVFLELDNELFEECDRKYQEDVSKATSIETKREETWKRLEAAAATRSQNYCSIVSDSISNSPTGFGQNLNGNGQRTMVGS